MNLWEDLPAVVLMFDGKFSAFKISFFGCKQRLLPCRIKGCRMRIGVNKSVVMTLFENVRRILCGR